METYTVTVSDLNGRTRFARYRVSRKDAVDYCLTWGYNYVVTCLLED